MAFVSITATQLFSLSAAEELAEFRRLRDLLPSLPPAAAAGGASCLSPPRLCYFAEVVFWKRVPHLFFVVESPPPCSLLLKGFNRSSGMPLLC